MSSSISSATQQQQFVQVQQSAVKADAATKTDPAKATAQTNAALNAQAPATPGGIKGIPESKSFRNSDGTYGPQHTATPPFNPLKASTKTDTSAAPESSEVGVNVKI